MNYPLVFSGVYRVLDLDGMTAIIDAGGSRCEAAKFLEEKHAVSVEIEGDCFYVTDPNDSDDYILPSDYPLDEGESLEDYKRENFE